MSKETRIEIFTEFKEAAVEVIASFRDHYNADHIKSEREQELITEFSEGLIETLQSLVPSSHEGKWEETVQDLSGVTNNGIFDKDDPAEEIDAARKKHLKEGKEHAHALIDSAEGTMLTLVFRYKDPKDSYKTTGVEYRTSLGGDIHDVVQLITELEKLKAETFANVVSELEPEEIAHLVRDIMHE